jgi:predicted LPLAT superfamily acyltransferase
VFAFKESSTHYHFFGSPLINLLEAPDRETGMEKLIGLFVQNLEQMVRQYPEQWFNYYNFWHEVSDQ